LGTIFPFLSVAFQVATVCPFSMIAMLPPAPFGFGVKLERVIEKVVPLEKERDPQTVAIFSPRSSKISTNCWLQAGEVIAVTVGVKVMVGVRVMVGVLVTLLVGVLVAVLDGVLLGVCVGVAVGLFVGVEVGVMVGVLVAVLVAVWV
jgi:hypothetical protein